MKNKISLILVTSIAFTLAACNSTPKNASTNSNQTTAKAADPIPQPGGFSNIDNAKVQEMLNQGVTLVDIRLLEEWQQTGIIKGSKTITFFDKTGRINPNFVPQFTKIADPEKPVMFICRTGNRTNAASQAIAQQLGYKKVLNVTHGITGWLAEKRPVVPYTPSK